MVIDQHEVQVNQKSGMAWSFYFDIGKPFEEIKDYKANIRLIRYI